MLTTDTIKSATDKKFTHFEKDVLATLRQKMSEHPISQEYAKSYDHINDLKASYGAISAMGQDTQSVDDENGE